MTAAVFRPALRLLVETWRPANAIASSYAKGRGSAIDLRTPHLRFHSPWMAYLPNRLLNKGGVPAELLVEPVAQGAILATSFERPDLSQPDQADATADRWGPSATGAFKTAGCSNPTPPARLRRRRWRRKSVGCHRDAYGHHVHCRYALIIFRHRPTYRLNSVPCARRIVVTRTW